MLSCPVSASPSSPTGAFHRIERFLRDRREDPNPVEDFESFEFELRSMPMEVENEAGCATLSFYDADGNRLETIRQGRMPRSGKPELGGWLVGELHAALAKKPGLQVVKVADGALDNWEFLEGEKLPAGISVVDFFHAIEHLAVALTSAYGEGSDPFKERFRVLRRCLRDDSRGVDKVIRARRHLREEHPRSKIITRELAYFRSRRRRMRYASLRARGLPIGSGVVEAACTSLATDRMKRSGMRWTQRGGQAVLTFRALIQSDRFEAGWGRVISAYKAHVSLPDNVIRFPGRTA